MSTSSSNTAGPDELGIFIDAEGNYRILLPDSWAATNEPIPDFAFLVVAALLRIARRDEVEFSKSLGQWARNERTLAFRLSPHKPDIKH